MRAVRAVRMAVLTGRAPAVQQQGRWDPSLPACLPAAALQQHCCSTHNTPDCATVHNPSPPPLLAHLHAVLQQPLAAEADVVLGALHVVRQVAEGHLGLDHPELGQVARGVAVLRAEGGAKGVDAGERAGVVLALGCGGRRASGAGGRVGECECWVQRSCRGGRRVSPAWALLPGPAAQPPAAQPPAAQPPAAQPPARSGSQRAAWAPTCSWPDTVRYAGLEKKSPW